MVYIKIFVIIFYTFLFLFILLVSSYLLASFSSHTITPSFSWSSRFSVSSWGFFSCNFYWLPCCWCAGPILPFNSLMSLMLKKWHVSFQVIYSYSSLLFQSFVWFLRCLGLCCSFIFQFRSVCSRFHFKRYSLVYETGKCLFIIIALFILPQSGGRLFE